MRVQTCVKIAGALLLTTIVAACGGSNNSSSVSSSSSGSGSLESKFGSEFEMIFDASSTSQPATPDSNAVPALAPAAQPVPVP